MNIKKELLKRERKEKTRSIIKKAFLVIRNLLCQHKDCYEEVIKVELGNCESSILEELLGEEAKNSHQMKMRITRCASCGRELYRTYFDIEQDKS